MIDRSSVHLLGIYIIIILLLFFVGLHADKIFRYNTPVNKKTLESEETKTPEKTHIPSADKPSVQVNSPYNRTFTNSFPYPSYAPPEENTYLEVPIQHGIYRKYFDSEGIAPLTFITTYGKENYFIKVIEKTNNLPIVEIFVYGGKQMSLKIPLGKYIIKYATGQNWYGDQKIFGKNTQYYFADSTFDFFKQENIFYGHTITLYKVAHGNLKTKKISENDF